MTKSTVLAIGLALTVAGTACGGSSVPDRTDDTQSEVPVVEVTTTNEGVVDEPPPPTVQAVAEQNPAADAEITSRGVEIVSSYEWRCDLGGAYHSGFWILKSGQDGWVPSGELAHRTLGPAGEVLDEMVHEFTIAHDTYGVAGLYLSALATGPALGPGEKDTRVTGTEVEIVEPVNIEPSYPSTANYRWQAVPVVFEEVDSSTTRLHLLVTNHSDYAISDVATFAIMFDAEGRYLATGASWVGFGRGVVSLPYGETAQIAAGFTVGPEGPSALGREDCQGDISTGRPTHIAWWVVGRTADGELLALTNWGTPATHDPPMNAPPMGT